MTRCGYVALIGAPNAGKSTLLNQLVGQKLAIVTPKVQTTRSRLLGIASEGDAQLIFVDTPGIFAPRRRLDRAMVAAAWAGASDADVTVLLVDAAHTGADDDTRGIVERLKSAHRPAILALNKIDLVRRDTLLSLADQLSRLGNFARVFMISSLTGDGVDDLYRHLAEIVPEGPFLFPPDQLSDAPERWLAAAPRRIAVFDDGRDRKLAGAGRRQRPGRAGDLCPSAEPARDRARRGRQAHQDDRRPRPRRTGRDARPQGAPLPLRQGARQLARRPRALPRDRRRFQCVKSANL